MGAQHRPNLPRPRTPGWRLLHIVWAFVAIVVCLLALAYYSLGLMSAGRAYVGGEGLWSKAQKEAVAALSRYAMHQVPSDYQAYQDALAVILGDRHARLALERDAPDWDTAVQGFLQGRNHPQDVDGMINLFLRFRKLPEIDRAVTAWVKADALIDQLIALGAQLHATIQAGTLNTDGGTAYQQKIQQLNVQLTPLEDDFSYALGEATRKTTVVLRIALLVIASSMVAVAYIFSVRMVQQSEKIHQALQDSENQLRNVLQLAPLPIMIVRMDNDSVVYANQRALAQFGVSSALVHSVKPQDFYVQTQDRARLLQAVGSQGTVQDWEVQLQDALGRPFWALISAERTTFGGQECMLASLTNINERKRAQEVLHHRAFHDELTGLPNRAMFMDALNRTLHRMARKGCIFSILFIDLDHFKEVNDTLGHAVGDLLLQGVAHTDVRARRRPGGAPGRR